MPSRSAQDEYANKVLRDCTIVGSLSQTAVAYPANGAIDPEGGVANLSKTGSAGAYTLANPTTAQEGTRLLIVSTSAFAHVVTTVAGINDGVTGGAKNAATFAAFAGASLELLAVGGKWAVLGKNVVTIA